MSPFEIHVYAFDRMLYDAPLAPDGDPDWWYHAHSLRGYGGPGYDARWRLPTISAARRSSLDPLVLTALLTGRPANAQMTKTLRDMLQLTGVAFDIIQLQPLSAQSTAGYKGACVKAWLDKSPMIRKVVLHDADPASHATVSKAVREAGARYEGVTAWGNGR